MNKRNLPEAPAAALFTAAAIEVVVMWVGGWMVGVGCLASLGGTLQQSKTTFVDPRPWMQCFYEVSGALDPELLRFRGPDAIQLLMQLMDKAMDYHGQTDAFKVLAAELPKVAVPRCFP